MTEYPENHDGPARPPVNAEAIRVARAKVALPATFLILNGLLGIVVFGALTGMHIANPMTTVEVFRKAIANQPDSPEKQQMEKSIQDEEDRIKADPDAIKRKLIRNGAIVCGTNALAILGAVLLRVTNRRAWGYVSAIMSMIPLATGCICTGLPFGLWGILILGSASVAEALDGARRQAAIPNPDGY